MEDEMVTIAKLREIEGDENKPRIDMIKEMLSKGDLDIESIADNFDISKRVINLIKQE